MQTAQRQKSGSCLAIAGIVILVVVLLVGGVCLFAWKLYQKEEKKSSAEIEERLEVLNNSPRPTVAQPSNPFARIDQYNPVPEGEIVRWTSKVLSVRREEKAYTVRVEEQKIYYKLSSGGRNFADPMSVVLTIYPRNIQEKGRLESLRPGESIAVLGCVRHVDPHEILLKPCVFVK